MFCLQLVNVVAAEMWNRRALAIDVETNSYNKYNIANGKNVQKDNFGYALC